jgi:hypothetical protein
MQLCSSEYPRFRANKILYCTGISHLAHSPIQDTTHQAITPLSVLAHSPARLCPRSLARTALDFSSRPDAHTRRRKEVALASSDGRRRRPYRLRRAGDRPAGSEAGDRLRGGGKSARRPGPLLF